MQPGHAIGTIAGVLVLRMLATTLAVGGGLFVPLVVQGALLGATLGATIDAPEPALFPLLRTDGPTVDVSCTLGDAIRAMEAGDVDRLPVLDDGSFVGLVTTSEIPKLDDILERTDDDRP